MLLVRLQAEGRFDARQRVRADEGLALEHTAVVTGAVHEEERPAHVGRITVVNAPPVGVGAFGPLVELLEGDLQLHRPLGEPGAEQDGVDGG